MRCHTRRRTGPAKRHSLFQERSRFSFKAVAYTLLGHGAALKFATIGVKLCAANAVR
jgi:hypothetical protein